MAAHLLFSSRPGDQAGCTLDPGWNMVGNPFGSAALLPRGTVAYRWNGKAYVSSPSIPPGSAVWVANLAGAQMPLTLKAM
jgi:hypothetical protein